MTSMMFRLFLALGLLAGCGDDGAAIDAGPDSTTGDTGTADTGTTDTATADTGTTDAGTDAPMSCDDGTMGGFDDAVCDTCFACALSGGICLAEQMACADEPTCDEFVTCRGGCAGDMTCIDACAVMFPAGATVWQTVLDCASCEACPNNCGDGATCP